MCGSCRGEEDGDEACPATPTDAPSGSPEPSSHLLPGSIQLSSFAISQTLHITYLYSNGNHVNNEILMVRQVEKDQNFD